MTSQGANFSSLMRSNVYELQLPCPTSIRRCCARTQVSCGTMKLVRMEKVHDFRQLLILYAIIMPNTDQMVCLYVFFILPI